MTPTLQIHLLGGFLLVLDDVPVTTIDWTRLQSLQSTHPTQESASASSVRGWITSPFLFQTATSWKHGVPTSINWA
jgi:hypothetical protein